MATMTSLTLLLAVAIIPIITLGETTTDEIQSYETTSGYYNFSDALAANDSDNETTTSTVASPTPSLIEITTTTMRTTELPPMTTTSSTRRPIVTTTTTTTTRPRPQQQPTTTPRPQYQSETINRINNGISTILNGVRRGSLEQILRGSFMFTKNENVKSVANNVLDNLFVKPDDYQKQV